MRDSFPRFAGPLRWPRGPSHRRLQWRRSQSQPGLRCRREKRRPLRAQSSRTRASACGKISRSQLAERNRTVGTCFCSRPGTACRAPTKEAYRARIKKIEDKWHRAPKPRATVQISRGTCPDGQVLESCEPVRFRCCPGLNRASKVVAARL
jgi:hypothetical protein